MVGKKGNLRIKAGRRAYEMIKDGCGVFDRVTTYYGPAVGPRWLIAAGFDRTLLTGDHWADGRALTLVGASAGAWRFAAWLQPQPEDCYQRLLHAYIDVDYRRSDTPADIQSTLATLIDGYIEDDALPFALTNNKYRIAIIACRARHLLAAKASWIRRLGMGLAFLANCMSRALIHHFAERVVFYSGPKPPPFCLRKDFLGIYNPLSETNFKSAVLASGAIPLVVEGIRDIYGAPYGYYIDGGLIDYHLNQSFNAHADDLTLFFHHQERIIPGWLDQRLKNRRPPQEIMDNVLMVFPADHFLARLPGGKVPERTDYITYIDEPARRKDNWRKAVAMAAPLGEEFVELVLSKKLRDVIEKM